MNGVVGETKYVCRYCRPFNCVLVYTHAKVKGKEIGPIKEKNEWMLSSW